MTTRCHTYTGQGFDPFDPRPEDVKIEDIAHHLAMICRFGGATPRFYSVAQHAVRVSMMVLDLSKDPAWALHALHHDSAEAYVHDIRRPIKKAMWIHLPHAELEFESVEESVMDAIQEALKLPVMSAHMKQCMGKTIKAADLAQLQNEFAGLFGEQCNDPAPFRFKPVRVTDCLTPDFAKIQFLALHRTLVADAQA